MAILLFCVVISSSTLLCSLKYKELCIYFFDFNMFWLCAWIICIHRSCVFHNMCFCTSLVTICFNILAHVLFRFCAVATRVL